MFNMLKVIDFGGGASSVAVQALHDRLSAAAESLPGLRSMIIGQTLPRDLNGGHIMWRMVFDGEDDCWNCTLSPEWRTQVAPLLAAENGLAMETIAYATGHKDITKARQSPGIWRCLVTAVEADAPETSVRQFERDLLLMPGYIQAIGSWALSRVVYASGRRRWTHVWEQEFADVEGLEGDYMVHPVHWGIVDAWFDPECPQKIVDPRLIHASIPIAAGAIR